MTTKAEKTADEKEQAKLEREARKEEILAKETELNKDKTGKGLRFAIGLTKGRNPQMVQYEAFDVEQPATLPESLSEFMDLSKVTDEKAIVGFLIDGFNDAALEQAADPTAEFVESAWPVEVQKAFKTVVKQYSINAGVSIEDAVALIKPGIVASQAKK